MTTPRTLVGLPEADGSLPFVALGVADSAGMVPLVAGLMGEGLSDVDGLAAPSADAVARFEAASKAPGLGELPAHTVLSLVLRALDGAAAPAPWAVLWQGLDAGLRNTAQLTDPLRGLPSQYVADVLAQPSALLDPEGPALFGLSRALVEDVVPELLDVVTGQLDTAPLSPSEHIAAVITQVADQALDSGARTRWSLSLDALALRAHAAGDSALATAARHTSLAMTGGAYGSEVPFVRVWTERALRSMVEAAQAMAGPGPVGPRIAAARASVGDVEGEA